MTLYSVALPNLPEDKGQVEKVCNYLKELKGFKYLAPNYPNGTLVLFDTLNNAKGGKNIMDYDTWQTGKNIMECEYDKEANTLKIIRKAN